MMTNKISDGVEVSVETFYQPDYSNPVSGEYMFAYRITIENHNAFSGKSCTAATGISSTATEAIGRQSKAKAWFEDAAHPQPRRTVPVCERLQPAH